MLSLEVSSRNSHIDCIRIQAAGSTRLAVPSAWAWSLCLVDKNSSGLSVGSWQRALMAESITKRENVMSPLHEGMDTHLGCMRPVAMNVWCRRRDSLHYKAQDVDVLSCLY